MSARSPFTLPSIVRCPSSGSLEQQGLRHSLSDDRSQVTRSLVEPGILVRQPSLLQNSLIGNVPRPILSGDAFNSVLDGKCLAGQFAKRPGNISDLYCSQDCSRREESSDRISEQAQDKYFGYTGCPYLRDRVLKHNIR